MTFDYKIIPVIDETIVSSHKIDGFSERRKTVRENLKGTGEEKEKIVEAV